MKKITDTQQFVEQVENAQGTVAVLFTQHGGDPCAKCDTARTAISHINPTIPVFDMSIASGQYPANELKIKTVPTLVVFHDGLGKFRKSGIEARDMVGEYTKVLKPYVAPPQVDEEE